MSRCICSALHICAFSVYYRPQRSCGQGYVFTRVCDSVHRGGGSGQGELPPGRENPPPPQDQTPPWSRHPPEQTPPPRRAADSSIRSTSGRYASYWNAFLLDKVNGLCKSFPFLSLISIFDCVILNYNSWSSTLTFQVKTCLEIK